MNRRCVLFALLLPAFVSAQTTILIRNVAVVDVQNDKIDPGETVLIQGNKITAIGTNITAPEKSTVINATGKYLIPGLWDMHVHCLYDGRPELFFPMFIANGVTGVREMGSTMSFGQINAIKSRIVSGQMTGPRLGAVAGKILDAEAWGPEIQAVTTPDEARKAVREHKDQGADFIKVYNALSRDVYFAIVDECKKLNMPFAGHLPASVTAREASNAGQRSIEHTFGILPACSSREDEFRRKQGHDTTWSTAEEIIQTYDKKKADSLFQLFATRNTYQCPTLVLFTHDSSDARLAYIPSKVSDNWKEQERERSLPAVAKVWYLKTLQLVGQMNRFHVPILAGTDAGLGNPYTFAGFSLHDELALLVKAGLTPCDALQSATINPANFLQMADSLGTVAVGKLADLVLLDGNPLQDITNTRMIDAVIANGRLFEKKALDEMLGRVKMTAGKK